VAFIMATTAPDKIPDTIVSRSQVFEFKTISSRLIAEQLSKIEKADGIDASPEAIALVARSAEGSMRDAETAFDQVIAFAGNRVTVEDVATVLGLVGRDLLFDVMTAVADENGPAAFDLAGRAVEAGYELRLLCRELSRLVRDLLVLSVDESRFKDPDVAPETDHGRLRALLGRFSREDLLRSFDVLARAEIDVKNAAEPRYCFEMALLRWIYLRKLTPLADLIDRLESGASSPPGPMPRSPGNLPLAPPQSIRPAPATSASVARTLASTPARPASPPARPLGSSATGPVRPAARQGDDDPDGDPPPAAPAGQTLKDAFLGGIEKKRPMLFSTMVAQAERIDVEGDRIVFRYGPIKTMMADQVAQHRAWLEELATGLAGRRVSVTADVAKGDAGGAVGCGAGRPAAPAEPERDLRAEAMKDPVVQSLLDVIPSELKDVTELKRS
jgi:DNA polymerase-3 subunit gamma/tau